MGARRPGKRPPGVLLRDARLSRYFGFWVGGLTARERHRLAACQTVLEAEDRLAAGQVSDDALLDVLLTATGDDEAAQTAHAAVMAARLRARSAPG